MIGYQVKQYLGAWEEASALLDKKDKLKNLLSVSVFVFFFKKDGSIYGVTEDGRLTFARMKNPEEEDEEWVKESNFSATNLSKAINGEKSTSLFGIKDLKEIKILTSEQALLELAKKVKDLDNVVAPDIPEEDAEEPAGLNQMGDDE
jgi:hypothetical protein